MRKILGALALALMGLGALVAVQPASAATQPVGGCKEAYLYVHSAGAQDCREAGWTIRPRLVVSPRGVVQMSTLPHCREEDGSGQRSACTWNIGHRIDGNGEGLRYWLDRHDRTHYVWGYRNPMRYGWHWATLEDQEAVDLIRTCLVRNGTTVASGLVARCPGV